MLPEALVIYTCLMSKGCSETSSQYYQTHPQFREFVEVEERRVKEALGPTVIQYWGPFIWAASGQEATIRTSENFYLTFKKETGMITFKRGF